MDGEGMKIGMTPPHPGSFVRTEILEELGLSVTRTAEVLGVRRATLSDLLNEKAGLSPEMALRIEKAFGGSMDTPLRMTAWYEGHVMRRRGGEVDVECYEPGARGRASARERRRRQWSAAGRGAGRATLPAHGERRPR